MALRLNNGARIGGSSWAGNALLHPIGGVRVMLPPTWSSALWHVPASCRVTLDVRTQHPWELVEAPTTPPLLCTAITDEEHEKALEDARQQVGGGH